MPQVLAAGGAHRPRTRVRGRRGGEQAGVPAVSREGGGRQKHGGDEWAQRELWRLKCAGQVGAQLWRNSTCIHSGTARCLSLSSSDEMDVCSRGRPTAAAVSWACPHRAHLWIGQHHYINHFNSGRLIPYIRQNLLNEACSIEKRGKLQGHAGRGDHGRPPRFPPLTHAVPAAAALPVLAPPLVCSARLRLSLTLKCCSCGGLSCAARRRSGQKESKGEVPQLHATGGHK